MTKKENNTLHTTHPDTDTDIDTTEDISNIPLGSIADRDTPDKEKRRLARIRTAQIEQIRQKYKLKSVKHAAYIREKVNNPGIQDAEAARYAGYGESAVSTRMYQIGHPVRKPSTKQAIIAELVPSFDLAKERIVELTMSENENVALGASKYVIDTVLKLRGDLEADNTTIINNFVTASDQLKAAAQAELKHAEVIERDE